MPAIADMDIHALNDAETSENRIHSDEIALKYGFNGALVSGVNVFGYLTQPLVKTYGADWLSSGILEVKFLKPAYQGELIRVCSEQQSPTKGSRHYLSAAYNEAGVRLAILESWLPEQLPAVNELAQMRDTEAQGERVEISWDLIHLRHPAPVFLWQPTAADNQTRVDVQRDTSSVYRGDAGFIHPYYLLDACNKALMRMFKLPAWIHTGSRLVVRKPLLVGQSIEVRAVPVKKWERKGHQFIRLFVSMWLGDTVALEVEHDAIFRIAV